MAKQTKKKTLGKTKKNTALDRLNHETVKPLRVRFCPSCKSTDVGFVFRLQNMFGIIPRVSCTVCGHSASEFPLLVIDDPQKAFKKQSRSGTTKQTTRRAKR